MPRSGDVYSFPGGAGTWIYPNSGDAIDSAAWKTLIDDIKAALSASLVRDGSGTMTGPLYVPNGSNGSPALSFSADHTTGFFFNNAAIYFSLNGSDIVRYTATGLEFYENATATWYPAISTGFAAFGARDRATLLTLASTGVFLRVTGWTQRNLVGFTNTSDDYYTVKTTGFYEITANLGVSLNFVDVATVQLQMNGVALPGTTQNVSTTANSIIPITVSTIRQMSPTDIIDVKVKASPGTTITVYPGSNFTIKRIIG
jgi:hypothetical protein